MILFHEQQENGKVHLLSPDDIIPRDCNVISTGNAYFVVLSVGESMLETTMKYSKW